MCLTFALLRRKSNPSLRISFFRVSFSYIQNLARILSSHKPLTNLSASTFIRQSRLTAMHRLPGLFLNTENVYERRKTHYGKTVLYGDSRRDL